MSTPSSKPRLSPYFLLVLLFSAQALAQEAPLRPGELEVSWGVRSLRAKELFDPAGERLGLEESLGFSDGVYKELSLEARLTYALDHRWSLTLKGPLLRAATLSGKIFSQGASLGRRIEASAGPGDLNLILAVTLRNAPKLRWGMAASGQLPTGDAGARLPRGRAFPSLGALLWGNHQGRRGFWRGSLRLGSGDGFHLEASTEQELGFRWRRVSVGALIKGRLPLTSGPPAPIPDAREQLTGVALGRAFLRAGPALWLHLGATRVFFSLETPLWGRSEAAGAEMFLGFRVGPKKRRSDW